MESREAEPVREGVSKSVDLFLYATDPRPFVLFMYR